MPEKKVKCLNEFCRRTTVYARGLCRPCYIYASKQVKEGKTTWKQLEDGGYCLPPKNAAKSARDWFPVQDDEPDLHEQIKKLKKEVQELTAQLKS